MDVELHCNILKCRRPLSDKVVVTTCSHIFCVDCAQEKFRNAQLCPACETSLTEPDDVVICSLQPTNDYKTSVLSGLSPSTILDICTRAMSFWQYQIHQESSFQQALLKNINERYATLQKQLENVIREANSELSLLNDKVLASERDLETERRKVRELTESSKEKDKEYQKLKSHYDKIKRKALMAPNALSNTNNGTTNTANDNVSDVQPTNFRGAMSGANQPGVNVSDVVSGMEAHGIQRTPVRPGAGGTFGNQSSHWPAQDRFAYQPQRAVNTFSSGQNLGQSGRQRIRQGDAGLARNRGSARSTDTNGHGASDAEVEEILLHDYGNGSTTSHLQRGSGSGGGQTGGFLSHNAFGTTPHSRRSGQQSFASNSTSRKPSGTFRPAALVNR